MSANGHADGNSGVYVRAFPSGGYGGSVIDGPGNGGNGGVASLGPVTGSCSSPDGGYVDVSAGVTGGGGGNAGGSGNGGKGASELLDTAISGSTTAAGTLSLTQNVTRGSGGSVTSGTPGAAGAADLLFSLNDGTSSSLYVTLYATGDNGGYRDNPPAQQAMEPSAT